MAPPTDVALSGMTVYRAGVSPLQEQHSTVSITGRTTATHSPLFHRFFDLLLPQLYHVWSLQASRDGRQTTGCHQTRWGSWRKLTHVTTFNFLHSDRHPQGEGAVWICGFYRSSAQSAVYWTKHSPFHWR